MSGFSSAENTNIKIHKSGTERKKTKTELKQPEFEQKKRKESVDQSTIEMPEIDRRQTIRRPGKSY